jgi:uncharacterized membrane protein YgdD (TMEM256/DUF423 family)
MPKLPPNIWFAIGAITAGIGVALGAFGAHGLKSRVTPDLLVIFETAARYQLYHAFALIAVGWAASKWAHPLINTAGWSFLIGILLFSGSLYILTMTGIKKFGAITPFGGLAFLIGWLLLAVAAWRS